MIFKSKITLVELTLSFNNECIYWPHLETSAAQVTVEWLVPGVFSTMGDEVGGLAERFSTNDAFMRLFTCKNDLAFSCVELLTKKL